MLSWITIFEYVRIPKGSACWLNSIWRFEVYLHIFFPYDFTLLIGRILDLISVFKLLKDYSNMRQNHCEEDWYLRISKDRSFYSVLLCSAFTVIANNLEISKGQGRMFSFPLFRVIVGVQCVRFWTENNFTRIVLNSWQYDISQTINEWVAIK